MKTMLDTWPGLLYGNAASVIPTLNDPKALARVKMQYFAAQLAAGKKACVDPSCLYAVTLILMFAPCISVSGFFL